ncbi:MAG: uracil-DNA glycosylase [Kiritimatiellia bacterium]
MKTDWREIVHDFLLTPTFARLHQFVENAYAHETVLPPREDLYQALLLCPFEKVRVVILGQDPYATPGLAHGLAFSVRSPQPPPPSLRNMLKELRDDVGETQLQDGDLTVWAQQGVLLLNALLTVRVHAPLSHAHQGWEDFTDTIIHELSEKKEHLVFLLWGAKAKAEIPLIDRSKHCILIAAHPSPLSAYNGFFGCHHFSKTNADLRAHGQAPIRW